jgi:hypothetical protein
VLAVLDDPVPDFPGGLNPRVDRVDDTNEDALPLPAVFGDGTKDPGAVRLAGQLDIEAADVQAEQARQQRGVVDPGAVGGIRSPPGQVCTPIRCCSSGKN